MKNIKSFLAVLFSALILDVIWIVGFMRGLYEREIGELLKADPNLIAALVFYVGYPAGIFYLIVLPALKARSLRMAMVNGGVLGAVAYGAFAVTNLSVVEGWTVVVTLADTGWGIFVTALAAACGYLAGRDKVAAQV